MVASNHSFLSGRLFMVMNGNTKPASTYLNFRLLSLSKVENSQVVCAISAKGRTSSRLALAHASGVVLPTLTQVIILVTYLLDGASERQAM